MRKERNELNKKLLSKKESELKDVENSQLVHTAKIEKAGEQENSKGIAKLSLGKEIMGDFPGGAGVKNPPANAGDRGSISGPGRTHMPRSN